MPEADVRRGRGGRGRWERLAGLAYVIALLMSVVACGIFSSWETQRQTEFAQAADKFGYLQMAADIRKGAAPHELPRFTVDSDHLRLFLSFLREHGVAVDNSGEYFPGVYHYAGRTSAFISPYPPGVGVMLSLFPAGRAVFSWQALTIIALLALAAWACTRALRRQSADAIFGAGMMCLVAQYGILSLGVSVSYSVDLSWIPLLIAVAGGFLGWRRGDWLGAPLMLIAGAALGWATVVRLSNGAFLLGFLLFVVGSGWKRSVLRAAMLCAGFFVAGMLPLMWHQAALTGSPFQSTYLPKDAAPPSAQWVGQNLQYYFAGQGSGMLWIFLPGCVAFLLWFAGTVNWPPLVTKGQTTPCKPVPRALARRWGWPVLAACLWWLVPTFYFLSHRITTPYYQFPTMFVTLAGMAWMVAVSERGKTTGERTK